MISSLAKFLRMPLIAIGVATSLLAFPSGVSLMIALWLVLVAVLLLYRLDRWAAAAEMVLAVILVSKLPELTFEFFWLVVLSVVTSIVLVYEASSAEYRWRAFGLQCLVAAAFIGGRWFDAMTSQQWQLTPDRSVVCLGDSLTEGTKGGYPAELAKLLSVPVLNFGRNGYTTTDAIKDLLPKIEQEKPQVVVLEIGGHDFRLGESRNKTKDRLRQIISRCQSVNAEVLIVEIPRGIVQDPWAGLERELAAEFDLQLISDTTIRRFVFFGPMVPPGSWLSKEHHLSKDSLHPNKAGQIVFAQVVADALTNR